MIYSTVTILWTVQVQPFSQPRKYKWGGGNNDRKNGIKFENEVYVGFQNSLQPLRNTCLYSERGKFLKQNRIKSGILISFGLDW
jgi:hypothetical protein